MKQKWQEQHGGMLSGGRLQGWAQQGYTRTHTDTHTDTRCAYAAVRACEHLPLNRTGSTSCKGWSHLFSATGKRHDRNPAQPSAEALERQVPHCSTGLPELLRHLAPDNLQALNPAFNLINTRATNLSCCKCHPRIFLESNLLSTALQYC